MESSILLARADAPLIDKIQQQYPPVTTRGGVALIAVAVFMPIIATIWTVLRVWTRRIRQLSPFLTEDVLCYLGLISFWGLAINYICMVTLGGAGYHIIHLRGPHIIKLSQTIFAAQVLYALTLGFTKMSITWMMKRIFFEQSYAILAYALMAFCFAWMLQTILTGVLICQPVNMNWDPVLRETGHCGNQVIAFAAVSIVDIITDILILALPLKLLWGLQMKKSYKIALAIVFGAGFVTIAFTIVRLYFVFSIDFADISYSSTKVSIIGTIQPGVAIIVASSALMRPILDRTVNVWLSMSMGSPFSGSGNVSSGKQTGASNGKMSTRSGLPSSAKRSRTSTANLGFRQISESEENLRWELDVMHADKGKTLTEVSNDPTASFGQTEESLPIGQIKVTQSTHVSRQ